MVTGARRAVAASWRSRPVMVLVLSWTVLFTVWVVVAAAAGWLSSPLYWLSLLAYWAGLAALTAAGVVIGRRRRPRGGGWS